MKRRLDRKGVAALEFGLLAPVLAALTVAVIEGVMLVRATYLVEYAAKQTAFTLWQQNNSPVLTPTILKDLCKGVRLALHGYDNSTLNMAIVSSTNDPSSTSPTNATPKGPRVVFEYDSACSTVAPALGLTPVATSLIPNAKDNVVEVKISLTYKTMFPSLFADRTLSAVQEANPYVLGDVLKCETSPGNAC